MAELRYNPILQDWIMVASSRQNRPQMPKDWCPFCPGSGRVPASFDVLRYMNDFPIMSANPPAPDEVASDPLFRVQPSYGRCEVLLYSPDHHATLAQLTDAHVHKLARMWQEVFCDLAADPQIRYVFIFENRGEEVGVTMPHPHGQAYAYPFLPQIPAQELKSALEYYGEKKTCLFCDLLAAEVRDGRRIIFANEHFTVYIPFFSQWMYGVHVSATRHIADISEMDGPELDSLGETVRSVCGMYDALFDAPMPYMMCMHNAPVNLQQDGVRQSYHFHIEFMPPMRTAKVQQYRASSESGAGAWGNPGAPEAKAQELRSAYEKYSRLLQD